MDHIIADVKMRVLFIVPSQSKQVFFGVEFSIRKFFTNVSNLGGKIKNLTSIFIIYNLSASFLAIKHYPNLIPTFIISI